MPNLTPALQNTDSWLDYMGPAVPGYRLPHAVLLDPDRLDIADVNRWCNETLGARWSSWSHVTVTRWVFGSAEQATGFCVRWGGLRA